MTYVEQISSTNRVLSTQHSLLVMEQSSFSGSRITATANNTGEFYNKLGMQYENLYGHDPGLHEIVRRFLDLLPVSGARVLDCGCGTGKPVAHMIAATTECAVLMCHK